MKISAVICTYRNPRMLANALDSLLSQSLPPDQYEVLVVDNDSGDETRDVVKKHENLSSGPEVRYLCESRRGLSWARNTAVEAARADIVAFLDDDALADKGWLSALLTAYDSDENVWAVGGKVLAKWEADRPAWLKDDLLRHLSIVEWGGQARPLQWPERLIGTNCSFRKVVFSEAGQFDVALGRKGKQLLGNEDTEIQERIHALGKKVVYTPEAVVHHRVPAERMEKRYFYRRHYGAGRSQAIVVAKEKGFGFVLQRAFRTFLGLPWRVGLVLLFLLQKEERFMFPCLCETATQLGFIRETLVMCFRRSENSPRKNTKNTETLLRQGYEGQADRRGEEREK